MATKIRIQFSVGVVNDGENAPVHERFITFGDDVAPGEIKNFFERCGLSVHNLFGQCAAPVALRLKNPASLSTHKITTIKLLREVSGLGLKDSKDIVEGSFNGRQLPYLTIGWCLDDGTAERIVEYFKNPPGTMYGVSTGVELEISREPADIDGVKCTPKLERRQ